MVAQQSLGSPQKPKTRLIIRQHLATRITHWIWAICLFFLLLSGLQIFNAHPGLYIGKEAGFTYSNDILTINSDDSGDTPKGVTTILGHSFDTTGVLGVSGSGDDIVETAFPGALTIPSHQDLATGRVVHFFFAWILVGTLLAWLVLSLRNRHLKKDLLLKRADITALSADIVDHARFRFHHTTRYSPLQKIAYGGVLFVLFPLIILTGFCMSPGIDSSLPWLLDIFGGRQTARTIHFITMSLLVLFFIVHMAMILAAGPINELRSIITGRYRIQATKAGSNHDEK
jgi:thiosulfate reductase cytochrome b subunit